MTQLRFARTGPQAMAILVVDAWATEEEFRGRATFQEVDKTQRCLRVDGRHRDPLTGASQEIDLGTESVTNGDGILLDGKRLWVVQNFETSSG